MPKGTTLKTIYCRNERCRWNDTCWIVQVNPDGSVPPPTDHTNRTKQYTGFEGHDQLAKDLMDALQGEYNASIERGAEIRRRGR
jgi:sulfatase maturation enzyme AslB (radical SAM superfamily)